MVLEEGRGPAIVAAHQVLGALDGGFEVWERVIEWGGLELVGSLADVDYVLEFRESC